MSFTQSDLIRLSQELVNFQNSLSSAQVALNNIISTGTVIYNDTSLPTAFPSTYAAFQSALLAAQTSINNFLNTFPAIPSL